MTVRTGFRVNERVRVSTRMMVEVKVKMQIKCKMVEDRVKMCVGVRCM